MSLMKRKLTEMIQRMNWRRKTLCASSWEETVAYVHLEQHDEGTLAGGYEEILISF